MTVRTSRRCNSNSMKKNTRTNSSTRNNIKKGDEPKNNKNNVKQQRSGSKENKKSVLEIGKKKEDGEKTQGLRRSARLREVHESKECNINKSIGKENRNAVKNQVKNARNNKSQEIVVKKEKNIKNENVGTEKRETNRKAKMKVQKELHTNSKIQKKRNTRSASYSKEITNIVKKRKGDASINTEKTQYAMRVVRGSPKKETVVKNSKNPKTTKASSATKRVSTPRRETIRRTRSSSPRKEPTKKKVSNQHCVEKKETKKNVKEEPSECTKVDFFKKTLKKRKLENVPMTIHVVKDLNKIIKECIKKNSVHKNYKNNKKFNIFSYGKGNVLYYLERIRFVEGFEMKNGNVKINGKSDRIKVSKYRFRIGSSEKLCDLVIKDDIEKVQCHLICKCVERNINKATYEHEQIHKYNLFILNMSENHSTILNDECVPFGQVKNEDYIYLGVKNAKNKIHSKYIYRVRFNTLPRILKYNYHHSSKNMNFDIHRKKGVIGSVLTVLSQNRSESVRSNFSLLNLVNENHVQDYEGVLCLRSGSLTKEGAMITGPEGEETENMVIIVVFRLIKKNEESNKERIYHIQMNSFGSLNSTPKKSILDQGRQQKITSISVGKIVKTESVGKTVDDSYMNMKNICQSRLSPFSMRGSVKKEEKNKNNMGMMGFGKGLPVTLLNACAELCKENSNTPLKVTSSSEVAKTNLDTSENGNEEGNASSIKKEENTKTMNVHTNLNNIFMNAFKVDEESIMIRESSETTSKKNMNETLKDVMSENILDVKKKDSYQGSNATTTSKEISDLLELQKEESQEVEPETKTDIKEIDMESNFSVHLNINEPIEKETIPKDEKVNNEIVEDVKSVNIENNETAYTDHVDNGAIEKVNIENVENGTIENIEKVNIDNVTIENNENLHMDHVDNVNIENGENISVNNTNNESTKNVNTESTNTNNTNNELTEPMESTTEDRTEHVQIESTEHIEKDILENKVDVMEENYVTLEYFDIPSEDGQKEMVKIRENNEKKLMSMEDDSILVNTNTETGFVVVEEKKPLLEQTIHMVENNETEKSQKNEVENHLNHVEYLNEGLSTDAVDKLSEENHHVHNDKLTERHIDSNEVQPVIIDRLPKRNEEAYTSQVMEEEVFDSNQSIYFECHEEAESITPVKYITDETIEMIEDNEKQKEDEVEENFCEPPYETKQEIKTYTDVENVSKDYVLCLKNENGTEQYVKMIGEIEVKRNSTLLEITQLIDSKLLGSTTTTTTEKRSLSEETKGEGHLDRKQKKYTVHLDPFCEKTEEDKFNECSALHLDYIDKSTFSDLELFDSSKLKKMLFIRYVEE